MINIEKIILLFVFFFLISCATSSKQIIKNQEFQAELFKHTFFRPHLTPQKDLKRGIASDSTQSQSNEGEAEVREETPYDGMWQFERLDCPEDTEPSPQMEAFKANPDMFAQFILDRGQFTMRVTTTKKEDGMLKKCIFNAKADYAILEGKLQVSDSTEATEECNGVVRSVPPIKSEISNILIRKNKAGEDEFVVPDQGGCVPYGGDVVLSRLPLG